MKPKLVLQIGQSLAIAYLAVISCQAERMRFERVPPAVREAIRAQIGAATVQDVDFNNRAGVPSYEVTFRRGGRDSSILFDKDGRSLTALAAAPAVASSRTMRLADLPEVVQQMARARAGNAVINSATEQIVDGQANYTVTLNSNGVQQQVVISQDGRILRDLPALAIGTAPQTEVAGGSSAYANLVAPVRLATRERVSVADLPAPVQRVINQEVGAVTIDEIARGTWNGKTIYQIGFRPNRQAVELQVDESGSIVFDPRSRPHVGSDTDLNARAQNVYPSLKQSVPLAAPQKVRIVDLPIDVQNAVKTQLGSAMVDDLQWGIWNGQRIYQLGFNWNDQHVQLQMDDYGHVVYDPRTQLKK
jgi:hypothetical protein